MENLKALRSASPKLLHLNQEHLFEKEVFLVKCSKIEIMITSIIEMLELPIFGHLTISTI